MKTITVFLLLLLWEFNSFGQLNGAQWMVGDLPTSVLDLSSDSVLLDTVTGTMYTTFTWADICDENGNLLYCTNGIYIGDKNCDTLMNGTGINPCPYTEQWACCGLDIPQAALFIPMPGSSRYYYLFHFSNDDADETRPQTIYYSLIDKEGNSGLGAVINKNVPILQNIILRGGGMTACKHANGRDYWIIMASSNTNTFYKFLLTPDSIFGPYQQSIGPVFLAGGDIAYSKFSMDGSKFATGILSPAPVLILNFDRCTGEFSNPDTIFNNLEDTYDTIPESGCVSVEFSPNNQFLYVSTPINLRQYDLLDSDVQDSVQIFSAANDGYPQIDMLQIAPNGKLYASPWNGGYSFLHVINNPDLKGDSCNFIYGGQPVQSLNVVCLPNMINYSLGPLVGSGCDTIATASPNLSGGEELIRIMPNPADKYVYVEMGNQGDYEFQLLNETGQLLDKKETRQVDIFDTEQLAAGVYFITVRDKNNVAVNITKKVVVSH